MIRLSRSEDYAVILINYLAKNFEKRLVPLSEIAKEYKISLLFLRNLANSLVHAGLITASEGKNGGYKLSKAPEEMKMGAVLQVFAKNVLLACCEHGASRGGNCDKIAHCEVGFIWRKLNKEFIGKIANLTIAEFANYP